MYSELIISGHEVQWHKKILVKCPNQYRAYGFFKDDAAQAVVDAIKARRREVHAACCVCEIPRYFTRSKSRPRCGPHMSYLSHGTCEIDMADFDMAHMKSDEAPRTWGKGLELVDANICRTRDGAKKVLRIPIWNKKTTKQLVLVKELTKVMRNRVWISPKRKRTWLQKIFNMSSDRSLNRKSPDFQVYVISDGVPISRRDICAAAVRSKHFAGKELPSFEVWMMLDVTQ